MEEKRAKTLDALSTFIKSQKTLLARTYADIDRLKELRNEVASQPIDIQMAPHLFEEFDSSTLKLSQQHAAITSTLPDDFEWAMFASNDPTPFKSLASTSRQSHAQQKQPSSQARPVLTPLQHLVRDGRRRIIDPVLASIPPFSSDSEEEPLDPEELRRIREREKIRDLKKRRIVGSGFAGIGGLGLRKPHASDGVHIRRDQEDESAEVDIWGTNVSGHTRDERSRRGGGDVGEDDDRDTRQLSSMGASSSGGGILMEIDTPATSVASPASSKSTLPPPPLDPSKSNRPRRPTRKAASTASSSSKPTPTRGKLKTLPEPVQDHADELLETNLDKKGKPRPETYKQAWSVSEQHLLERLLEEIPEGEKNRWAKISKAMNGRRTSRQVASRVQKYYEKLKRFGLDVAMA